MSKVIRTVDISFDGWPPGTKFYSTDDDKHFVVIADLVEYPSGGAFDIIRQPTKILYTDETGHPGDLVPDFTFDPGTTHEDAIINAGFSFE